MDTESKFALKQITERLDIVDTHQKKLDRVMEQLEVLQSTLVQQNQRQNLLDEKLVAITTKLQQVKIDMRQQFQEGLYEIVEPLLSTDSQEGFTKYKYKTLQQLQGLSSQIGDTLKSMDARIVDTAQKCHQLTSFSLKMENKIDNIQGHMTTLLERVDRAEAPRIRSHTTVIKEMEELSKQTTMINEFQDLNTDLKDYINKTKREIFAVTEKEAQIVRDGIQGPLVSLGETIVTETETQSSQIINAVNTAKEDLRHLIQTEGNNTSKNKVKIDNFFSSLSSFLKEIQKNMETVLEKVDSTQTLMIEGHTEVIKQMEDLSTQTKMNKQLENLTSDIKDYIYQTKREIFAVTEKEAQIVRDRIQGPLVSLGNYTFDFYLDNFQTLVRSGKRIDSPPWHINELQTCVTGCVVMSTNGEIEVWLAHGRHPREVGLQPRSAKTLKVKATICDINKKKLQPLDIGEESRSFNESDISNNRSWGYWIGVTSCDVLLEKGYGQQEGYARGALLIRYDVTVE